MAGVKLFRLFSM